MKFVAIDYETANAAPQSACSFGMLVFDDGVLVHSYHTLLKPPKKYGRFLWGNQCIHNISPEMVEDAPNWEEVYPEIAPWFNEAIIIAHNAEFDMRVLVALNRFYHLPIDFNYMCTVQMSRVVHPQLPNHKLSTVSEYLSLNHQHHDALSDAYACSMIMVDAMVKTSVFDIYELAKLLNLKIKNTGGERK